MSIQVKNIEKHFGAFHALKNISLDFPDGQLVGITWAHLAVVKPPCYVLLQG